MSLSKNENQERNDHRFASSKLENEEPVQLMLCAADTGMSLAKVAFRADLDSDECILSGFLTALNHAGDLMFSRSFDRITFGQYTMLLRVEPPFLFSYVFSGSTTQASRRLCEFINILREQTSLLNALKTTITSGFVDQAAKSFINTIATQVFADFESPSEA